ncbi:MAG: mandelate racemase, partial [Comamonadaceae bacterium]
MSAMATAHAPSLRVEAIDCGVRAMALRLPFRFGAVTLTHCPQLFVRATVDLGALGTHTGWAAEMMVPRWFDKRAEPTQGDNVRDLQAALDAASAAYRNDRPATAFGLFERHYRALMAHGSASGRTALSTSFGQAVLDRAVLDALCQAASCSIYEAFRRNLVGMTDSPAAPDLQGWRWDDWLAALKPADSLHARHTVGMLDALEGDAPGAAGLPVSLPGVIARYGHRYFKIKLGGDPDADLARLADVLRVLDARQPGHRFSLDGNEQYADPAALAALCEGLRRLPALSARPEALLYIEQPVPRDASLSGALAKLDAPAPLLLDEADGTLDAFPAARNAGWRGISSKSCKGIYKALINRARCDRWNAERPGTGHFMSAEDLTCQAGLSVQQDLALAALLGLDHCERNGHHYVDGFGDAPAGEQSAFAAAHPDLYESSAGRPRLRIESGRIAIGSLAGVGFAHSAVPDFDSLRPLQEAASMLP